jgi:hypothetical protein
MIETTERSSSSPTAASVVHKGGIVEQTTAIDEISNRSEFESNINNIGPELNNKVNTTTNFIPEEQTVKNQAEQRYPQRSNRSTYQEASAKRHDQGYSCFDVITDGMVLNLSVKESLTEEPTQAKNAILSEFHQLIVEYKAIFPVPPGSATTTILPSKMIMKKKCKADGSFDRWKARLAAGGHRQDKSQYPDNSSPTVQTSSVMMELNIAAYEDRSIEVLDVKGAFLNATLKNPQFIRVNSKEAIDILLTKFPDFKTYVEKNGTMVFKVTQALYGLIESNQLWYLLISGDLESIGYQPSPFDNCFFIKTEQLNNKTIRSTLCLHVDDILHTFNHNKFGSELKEFLKRKYSDISLQNGNKFSYLGMQIQRDRPNKTIFLDQSGYIDTFIKKFEITGTAKTPATSDLLNIEIGSKNCDVDEFLSGVMTLMYLALRTRPDILFAVAYLSTKVQKPTEHDWNKLIRIFRYINGTKDLQLRIFTASLQLHCWADASFAIHADSKSHSGYVIGFGVDCSLIFVRSTKQKLTTKSSTESELVAINDCASHIIWAMYYLEFQNYTQSPIILFQDNQSTMVMANKGKGNPSNSKHINIRYFYIKELIDAYLITLKYCSTSEMKADLMTKPIIGNQFKILRGMILNIQS